MRLQNVHPSSLPFVDYANGRCLRSVAVLANLYREIGPGGWGIFKWPQVGDLGGHQGVYPQLLKMLVFSFLSPSNAPLHLTAAGT